MSQTITVATGARLHFGPLSYKPSQGRHFGGVGVMIDEPGCRISLQASSEDNISGRDPAAERLRQLVAHYRRHCPSEFPPPQCGIILEQSLPSHSGLGSGTQLGLAVARGLSALAGETGISAVELACRVGRGRRSAVGIHGFEQGGLIVDAGRHTRDSIGALACRLPMPPHWQVLLITPRDGDAGLSGEGEEHAFESLGAMPAALTDRLCRIVLADLLPAVQSASFAQFSDAVHEYGRLVGEFFAPVQGGRFGNPRTDLLISQLRENGICGAGQTSWGPTVFAFVPDAPTGSDVAALLSGEFDVQLVAPRNTGAACEQIAAT